MARLPLADSHLSLSPYEILPVAPENKYFMIFSYIIMTL